MPLTLEKGDSVKLEKDPGEPALKVVTLGLGWDPVGASIDLDAWAILFKNGQAVDTVWFRNLSAPGVRHSGDNLTGEGDGDDETIAIDLTSVDADAIVVGVNSFLGQTFNRVANAYVRLLDTSNGGEELLRYPLGAKEETTGVLMAKLTIDGTAWRMTALGTFKDGRTVEDMKVPATAATAAIAA